MLSIIIPAYNEEKRIGKTLKEFRALWGDAEVIVVSDGSTDRTVEVAKEAWPEAKIIKIQSNRGKGFAIRRGVKYATGDVICIMDADGAAPPEEIKIMQRALIESNIAIGYRPSSGRTFVRNLVGRCYGILVRLTTGLKLMDTQCGFKAYKRDCANAIFGACRVDGFGIDVEVLLLARLYGYKVAEIPINWREISGSKVNLVKDSWLMLWELFRAIKTVQRGMEDGRIGLSDSVPAGHN